MLPLYFTIGRSDCTHRIYDAVKSDSDDFQCEMALKTSSETEVGILVLEVLKKQ